MPTKSTSGYYENNIVRLQGALAKAPEVHDKVAVIILRIERGITPDGNQLKPADFPVTFWLEEFEEGFSKILKKITPPTPIVIEGHLAWRPRRQKDGIIELTIVATSFEAMATTASRGYKTAAIWIESETESLT